MPTGWRTVRDDGTGAWTVFVHYLSFSGASRAAAVAAGLKSPFTALVSSSVVAAGCPSSDTTIASSPERSEGVPLEEGKRKRQEAFNDGEIDEKYYDAKSDDDDEEEVKYEDVDVEEFETLLKDTADYLHSINSRMSATNTNNNAMSDLPISTKFMSSSKSAFSRVGSITSSNALRSTNSTNATAPPSNEATRIVTPTTEDSTEDVEKVNTTRTEECNAEDSDVNDSSKRSSSGYYQDLEGNWTSWIQCASTKDDEKEQIDAGVELARSTLQDDPRQCTHQAGIHAVTPLTVLKLRFLLPIIQGILPAFLSLLLAAKSKGWGVFTTASLNNLVEESKFVFRGFVTVLGCVYVKAIHQTIEWWNRKIAWCQQHCKDILVLAFARRVSEQIGRFRDGETHFTSLYIGETIRTLAERMTENHPRNIFSWFGSPTHIFKVVQAVDGTVKRMRKCLSFGMEASVTSLSEEVLPSFGGHLMNSTWTGYRPFFNENPGQYVSFEELNNGKKRVLEVHENWKGFEERFGYNGLGLKGTTVKNMPDVFRQVPAYDSLFVMYVTNRDAIEKYIMSSMETDGGNRAYDIRHEFDTQADVCSFGYLTSSSGVFTEPGEDYNVFDSLAAATGDKRKDKTGTINGVLPGPFRVTAKHIIDATLADPEKGLFVPRRKDGGKWIKLSGLVYRIRTDVCYPFSLEDLELDPVTSKYKLRKTRQMDDEENEEEL